ncbi:MAG TPA: carbon-nitrogen hydrolase family protein [Dehalococcoidia bacterium]|nr:carbon-nitrogen hydrolase family protein [Dehalococcoidia bacterium]
MPKKEKHDDTVTLAVAAMNAAHDTAKNLAKYASFIDEAAAQRARLLVLPEESLQGYLYHLNHELLPDEANYLYETAEPIPGPSTQHVAKLARKAGMYVIFGMTERVGVSSAGVLYNSAVLVGPRGLIGVYRKVHAPGDEYHIFRQGRDWPVFDTEIGRIGMHICYDMRFPEAAREMALKGAEILVLPTAWPQQAGFIYDVLDRARAAENECWFLSSNQAGACDQGRLTFYGHSRIIGPLGNVLADSGDDEGIATAEVPAESLQRRQWGSMNIFHDRRPDTYRSLASEEIYNAYGKAQSDTPAIPERSPAAGTRRRPASRR